MQQDEQLGRLVELIGAMKWGRSQGGYQALVIEDPTDGDGVYREYQVTARPHEGVFEYTCRERAGVSAMSYRPAQKLMVLSESGGEPEHVEGRDIFPAGPPVLAMFSPLELPIWGGDRDGQRVTSTSSEGDGAIRLNFAPKDEPAESPRAGYAIIDLSSYIATELFYLNSRFTAHDIKSIPLRSEE